MKGSSTGVAVRVSAAFAGAFTVAAVVSYALVAAVGAATHVVELPLPWRLGIAAAGLVAFAVVDVVAIRRRSYCPLSWRRQTPQGVRFRYGATTTAAVWGFDTGLGVTTFRVAALTWAALLLTFLGLAPWQIGFAYAAAFVLPVLAILNGQPVGSRSSASLEVLLRTRAGWQRLSVVTLSASAILLMAGLAA